MSFGLQPDARGVQWLTLFVLAIPVFVLLSFWVPLIVVVMLLNFVFLYLMILFLLLYLDNPAMGKAPPLTKPYSLAVLIPSFNSKNTIERCIQTVTSMEYPIPFRVVVVDDGSIDGSYEMLLKMKGIELHRLPQNQGKGFALNAGLKTIHEDLVVCIDSDTYLEAKALKKVAGYFDDPRVGAVNGVVIPDHRRTFWHSVQFFEYILSFGIWNTILSSIDGMSYMTGPFMVFRRTAFEKCGYYFDTKNLAEDMEIGLRFQTNGYKIKVCSDVVNETDCPATVGKWLKQRDRWYRSRVFNLIKYRNLFFQKENWQLGFFVLPYLFFVELLMVALLLRVAILFGDLLFSGFQSLSAMILHAHFFPNVGVEVAFSAQAYFYVVSMAGLIIFYALGLRLVNYKPRISDLPPILVLVVFYPFLIAFAYGRGMVRELQGVKPIWERVST